jgi:hypothetical protein
MRLNSKLAKLSGDIFLSGAIGLFRVLSGYFGCYRVISGAIGRFREFQDAYVAHVFGSYWGLVLDKNFCLRNRFLL